MNTSGNFCYGLMPKLLLLGSLALGLSACGTPAITGVSNNVSLYDNSVSRALTSMPETAAPPETGDATDAATVATTVNPVIALSPTPLAITPANDMSGMDTGGSTVTASAGTVAPAATGPTPTDYILYNILYPSATPGSPAQSATLSPAAAATMPPTVQTTVPTLTSAATTPATAAVVSGVSNAAQYSAPLNGNAANGKALFSQAGCSGCHNVAIDSVLVGPSLKGVATRALTRKPGYSAVEYLRESILIPNAYIVPGFNSNIMPATFGQQLSHPQIDDLVTYLLTLNN